MFSYGGSHIDFAPRASHNDHWNEYIAFWTINFNVHYGLPWGKNQYGCHICITEYVIYQTQGWVFHQDIQTVRSELKNKAQPRRLGIASQLIIKCKENKEIKLPNKMRYPNLLQGSGFLCVLSMNYSWTLKEDFQTPGSWLELTSRCLGLKKIQFWIQNVFGPLESFWFSVWIQIMISKRNITLVYSYSENLFLLTVFVLTVYIYIYVCVCVCIYIYI